MHNTEKQKPYKDNYYILVQDRYQQHHWKDDIVDEQNQAFTKKSLSKL